MKHCFDHTDGSPTREKGCVADEVLRVTLLAPAVPGQPRNYLLTYCCRECIATAKANGYITYQWTDLVRVCHWCHRSYRISHEALDDQRAADCTPDAADSDVADGFECCLTCCCNGDDIPGEHDADGNDVAWQIERLTAREVFAIHAALTDAFDFNADELYPGVTEAIEKLEAVREQAIAAGFKMKPETSVQSQCYIDGVGAWDDGEDEIDDEEPTDARPFVLFNVDGIWRGDFATVAEARARITEEKLNAYRIMHGLVIVDECPLTTQEGNAGQNRSSRGAAAVGGSA